MIRPKLFILLFGLNGPVNMTNSSLPLSAHFQQDNPIYLLPVDSFYHSSFLINSGCIQLSKTGKTVNATTELENIVRAIRKPNCASMLNFDSIRTANPHPTEMALIMMAFPDVTNVRRRNPDAPPCVTYSRLYAAR